jgi:hypothetical protein
MDETSFAPELDARSAALQSTLLADLVEGTPLA